MVIDTELLIDYPETERKVDNLLKFNNPEERKLTTRELLRLELKDFVRVILEDGREFVLSVINVFKDNPTYIEQMRIHDPYIELSNKYMGDKYDYVIDINDYTLTFRRTKTGVLADGEVIFRENIKDIYYLGGKAKN